MIKEVQNITIEDYNYPLPDERIAKYPLSERDASKLLVLKNDDILSSHFKNIGPPGRSSRKRCPDRRSSGRQREVHRIQRYC